MSNLNGGLSGSGTLRGTLGGGGVPAQDVYWDDILNKPNFAAVATSGSYNDLVNKPTLAPVATSGSYNDLTNTPTIPAAQVNADWNATSGVAEILNKPTIPAAQVNADWNATSGVAEILNKPTIPTTASQIDYDNTASGLQADDVQDAISELKSNLTELSDYSTTEQAVGKWIDGTTTVYKKTFSFTTTSSTDQVLSIGSTITKLLAIEGGLNYTSGGWYAPQTYFSTNDQFTVWITTNNTEIKIRSGTINGRDGWVTIYYTK